ncbi:MAG: efflux RND transporter permease subunit [Planctomycetes bacterium]|nr:efflux RND transporter permease subunit [Planctomycetota bacterium]
MNVSAWSIRHPVPAVLLFALLCALGLWSFHRLGIQHFPDIDFPAITVSAGLEGASPAQLETEVARKLEDAIAGVAGIEHLRTTITDGSVSLTVQFGLERNLGDALDEVRDAVERTRADLPADLPAPVVSKVTVAGRPVLTFVAASDSLDEEALSWWVDDTAGKALLAVPGVGRVARIGGVDREVLVELDPARIDALGIGPAALADQLARVHLEASGGRGEVGGARQSLRTAGRAGTAAELAALELPLGDGRRVRLDQVASVRDTVAERGAIARYDGAPVVGFEVSRSTGASEVAVAEAVRAAVRRLGEAHPRLRLTEASDSVAPALESYRGSMLMLAEGALLAVAVVLLFLRNLRATLISAAALPLSVIPTFLAMHLLGFTLNTITLLALALVVGILVDDAIVEIENIVRHQRGGKPPRQAALEAADEIGLAVIATTFTLVAVFLPTAFMPGIPGLVFRQFGWTAGIAVVASLLVARLLTPMMAAHLMKALPPEAADARDGGLMRGYLALAAWCLRHRLLTVAACALFLGASLLLVPLLPKGFMPAQDRGQTTVGIELPPGSPLAATAEAAARVRPLIAALPEVRHVIEVAGAAGGGGGGPGGGATASLRQATLTVVLAPRGERQRSQAEVESALRHILAAVPGVRITVGSGHSGEKLEVVLAGDDAGALASAAQAVVRDLRALPGLGNVTSSASLLQDEVRIVPDHARAAELGVTSAALAATIRLATAGDFAANLAKLDLPQRQVPIRVRLAEGLRGDLEALRRLKVAGAAGAVPLAAVATVELGSGPAAIARLDRSRQVTLAVELNGRSLGAVQQEVDRLPALAALPPGVVRSAGGDAERMAELFGAFGTAMAVGVLCIYLVLVLLFHDFLQPVTILAALPLAVGGALLALLLTRSGFSMPSVIGLLMLMGIVTKNSILLVDYAVIARRRGLARTEALLDACHKRARPIVMTTLAMGLGMLPIALGLGSDAAFRAPMAITVIGGLITSTLLSLLVVPVAFTVVDDCAQAALGRLRRPVSTSKTTTFNQS